MDISNCSTLTFLKLWWTDEPLLADPDSWLIGKTGSKHGHPMSWGKQRVSIVNTIKAWNEFFWMLVILVHWPFWSSYGLRSPSWHSWRSGRMGRHKQLPEWLACMWCVNSRSLDKMAPMECLSAFNCTYVTFNAGWLMFNSFNLQDNDNLKLNIGEREWTL